MLNGKEKAAVEFITQGITPHQGGISRDLVGSLDFYTHLVVTGRYPTNAVSKRDC